MRSTPRAIALAIALGGGLGLRSDVAAATSPPELPTPTDIPAVEVVVAIHEFGNFTIRFDRSGAPNHVANFLWLAREGFYDGLAVHRVIPGYLVQLGDPSTREAPEVGGPPIPTVPPGGPYRLPPEPTSRSHARGTVSMAWRGDRPGTAFTEWFVTLNDAPAVDGHATPIGMVVEGLDVVDRIAQVSTGRDRRPRHPIRIVSVTPRSEPAGGALPSSPLPRSPIDETPPGEDPDGVSEVSSSASLEASEE